MTPAELRSSARSDGDPPANLSPEARALWLSEAGRWHEAHEIAQEIPSALGSWIHALLHLIEGDIGNASYWFARAGRPPVAASEAAAEWERIANVVLASGAD